ncbi:MAG: HAMP domain-containing histidine kinase [Deltaproteobacteria bacterium]|nr:HAMP domain-containing histidine kinase [Deltaproteobacteria bacterium]
MSERAASMQPSEAAVKNAQRKRRMVGVAFALLALNIALSLGPQKSWLSSSFAAFALGGSTLATVTAAVFWVLRRWRSHPTDASCGAVFLILSAMGAGSAWWAFVALQKASLPLSLTHGELEQLVFVSFFGWAGLLLGLFLSMKTSRDVPEEDADAEDARKRRAFLRNSAAAFAGGLAALGLATGIASFDGLSWPWMALPAALFWTLWWQGEQANVGSEGDFVRDSALGATQILTLSLALGTSALLVLGPLKAGLLWGTWVVIGVSLSALAGLKRELQWAFDNEKNRRTALEDEAVVLEGFQMELTNMTRDLFAVNQLAQSVLREEDEDLLMVALAIDLADEFDGVVTRVWSGEAHEELVLSSEAGRPVACRLLNSRPETLKDVLLGEGGKRWTGSELDELVGEKVRKLGIQCCIQLPIVQGGVNRGIIELWSRQDLPEASMESLELLANIVGVGLSRLQTEQHLEDEVFARTEALLKAMDEAEAANQLKGQFLANMSHELRTPLHGVLSFARFGVKKIQKASPEKLLGYFKQIESSGELLLRLVNDLLDLSKLEAGAMEMHREESSLQVLVGGVVDELSALFSEKKLEVKVVSQASVPKLFVDRKRLGQVVRNLLSNALKFSPAEGKIYCRIERTYNGRHVRLSIEDEGMGIPADELNLVFDKFSQSSATKTGAGGTGLGLPICRELTEAHDGRLWAENREVGGAVFYLELPIAQNSDAEREPDVEESPLLKGDRKIRAGRVA